jgi:hypothetical protein
MPGSFKLKGKFIAKLDKGQLNTLQYDKEKLTNFPYILKSSPASLLELFGKLHPIRRPKVRELFHSSCLFLGLPRFELARASLEASSLRTMPQYLKYSSRILV